MRLLATAPVLSRSASSAQVGVRRPLVLDGLSAAQMRFLGSLEGGRAVGRAEQRRHAGLLDSLANAALTAAAPPSPAAIRFHSAGALAVEAATALARVGWAVAFLDAAAAHPRAGREPIAPGSTVGVQASQLVRRAVPGARVHAASAHADLDVLIGVGLPLTRTRSLLASDAPHLLVACDERGVTVGPAIVPGRGACAQCLGLHATELDERWPQVALQCEGRRPRTDPLTAGLAGMLVARLAVDFAAGRASTMWRVDEEGVSHLATPSPHPGCRCSLA